ncbi:hypothetical protein [Frondihabitans sp. PAMC 28766]|uniref:hypothetical protein n=1 Tax=Frondihabitans sp. PAMC 28766 TaxID=1795630 RepID=UPI001EF5D686|nr:hypothetical protein [Frondihabitans sp. PAMC 28766]
MRPRTLAAVTATAAVVTMALSGCAATRGATVGADGRIDGAGQTLNVLTGVDTVYPSSRRSGRRRWLPNSRRRPERR